MPSELAILKSLRRLMRNIRTNGVPSPDELPDLAADWLVLLADLSDADLAAAVDSWLRGSCPFWPMPGQVRALAPSVQAAAAVPDMAMETFHAVVRFVATHGSHVDPVSHMPELQGSVNALRRAAVERGIRALGLGGHRAIGMMTDDAKPFRGQEFARGYRESLEYGAATERLLEVEDLNQLKDELQKRRGHDLE